MFLSMKKPSCALLTVGALAWAAGCTESASSDQPAWPLTPACLAAPSLPKASLDHPCFRDVCRHPDCRDPAPPQGTRTYVERLVCIDQNTYRCVPDDLTQPSLGRYELVERGCCKVRSADLSLSFDVLERPRTWSDARIDPQYSPNGLCYDLSRSQLTFKARLRVTNRGNLPVRAHCYVLWYPIHHTNDSIFAKDIWRTHRNSKFSLDLDYGPPTELDLAPGQSQSFEINHWPTPEELCPVYVRMTCRALDEHPDVEPTPMDGVEAQSYIYNPSCGREPFEAVGDFELPEEPKHCAEFMNEVEFKLNPQFLDQEP